MASSILNSDDGVISGTSGLKSTGGDDGVLVFQSKGTETARINTDKQIVAAAGTASLPIYSTTGDTNTGIFFPAADQVAVATNGVERVNLGNSATVFNDGGADVDFRVEGDTEANLFFVDAGNDRVGVKTATPAVALDVVGQVRASTGILFGSDTAAANTLDDYEEGTWTPTLTSTNIDVTGVTYNSRVGTYVKIGKVVYYVCGIKLTGVTSTGSGEIVITGLPFTTTNEGAYGEPSNAAKCGFFTTASVVTNGVFVFAFNASTALYFREVNNADTSIASSQITADTFITVEGFYYAA